MFKPETHIQKEDSKDRGYLHLVLMPHKQSYGGMRVSGQLSMTLPNVIKGWALEIQVPFISNVGRFREPWNLCPLAMLDREGMCAQTELQKAPHIAWTQRQLMIRYEARSRRLLQIHIQCCTFGVRFWADHRLHPPAVPRLFGPTTQPMSANIPLFVFM